MELDTQTGAEQARQAELDALKLVEFEDAAFDDIARMARDVCDTPVALVSIIDGERQWFKARVGLDEKETPRAISFCTHTNQRPDRVMVVEDAPRIRVLPRTCWSLVRLASASMQGRRW